MHSPGMPRDEMHDSNTTSIRRLRWWSRRRSRLVLMQTLADRTSCANVGTNSPSARALHIILAVLCIAINAATMRRTELLALLLGAHFLLTVTAKRGLLASFRHQQSHTPSSEFNISRQVSFYPHPAHNRFQALGEKYNTDKVGRRHNYQTVYGRAFEQCNAAKIAEGAPFKLLEIGKSTACFAVCCMIWCSNDWFVTTRLQRDRPSSPLPYPSYPGLVWPACVCPFRLPPSPDGCHNVTYESWHGSKPQRYAAFPLAAPAVLPHAHASTPPTLDCSPPPPPTTPPGLGCNMQYGPGHSAQVGSITPAGPLCNIRIHHSGRRMPSCLLAD